MLSGLLVLVAAVLAATAFGLYRRVRDGRVVPRPPRRRLRGANLLVSPEEIGAPLGARATLLQFSTAFCAPCRSTRRTLAEVAAMVEGVAHVEVDAESRLALVRRLGVVRTPTVFVLDAAGRVARSAQGAPRKADVIGALGEMF